MSDVTFRRAVLEDASGFEAVIRAAYAPWQGGLEGLPDVAAGIAGDIATHTVLLAESPSGEILGGVVVVLGDGAAHVANLAVAPGASGQGLGRRLMQQAEIIAREAGYRTLDLTTHRDMQPTLEFHSRNGWTETGREGMRVFLSKPL